MHVKQPGFTYSACRPFMKHKERIQKFKQTEHIQYNYQNELDRSCFQHDITYGNFLNLTRKTASDKIFRENHLTLPKIRNMMGINVHLFQWSINFLIKRLLVAVLKLKIRQTKSYLKNYRNQLLENLRKEKYTTLL